MGALEDFSQKLDSAESSKNTLRKSICSLVTDWREVEKDLELTKKSFQEYLSKHQNGGISLPYLALKERELKEREASLNGFSEKLESDKEEFAVLENLVLGRLREVGLTEERLELRERRIEEREKAAGASKLWVPLMEDRVMALEMKEKEASLFREDLELKEKDISMLLNVSEKREKELDKRERQLEVKRKFVEELESSVKILEEELGAKRKYFAELESSVKSLERELEVKRKDSMELESSVKSLEEALGAKMKEFSVAEQRLMKCKSEIMELDVKRKGMEELGVREKQWELKEKQCRSKKKLLEREQKELERKMKEFEARMKASEIKEIEHRNCAMKEIEVREKKLKAKEKELEEVTQERLKEWQLKQKQCHSDNKALDLRMKEFEDRMKESLMSKSCNDQDQKEDGGRENPNFPGSDLIVEAQGEVEVAQEVKSSTNLPKCLKGCQTDPELSNSTSEPMAVIIANMDAKSLFAFLNTHNPFLQNEVLVALEISRDSAKLVLDVVECFYMSYPRKHGSRSCILLLDQLMRISPLNLKDVQEIALRIAMDWKAKIIADSRKFLANLVFLVFVCAFRLVSAFDSNELLQLYKIVSEQKSSGIPEVIYGVVYSQLESQQIETEAMQLEIKPPTSGIAPRTGVEVFDSHVNMESDESRIPMFLKHSSDAAVLVLDALDFNNVSDSKEKKISVVKSVYHLLKQVASVSLEIKPCARNRASKFALDWKSKLTDSNSWEVLAFLLFVGVYGLFSSFGTKYVMGLLEVHSQLVKEASSIIRIFKLEHKVPGFIMSLIKKKQRLIAFDYVYEFNLVDKIPPVALLKKHVLDSKLAAKKSLKGQIETEDGAISDEISTLKDVIKCILDHSLESEYSPDMLRERITCLEARQENLKKCRPADITYNSKELNPVEKEQLGQELTGKRPASDPDPALPSPSKKLRHKSKNFSKDRSSPNVPPFAREGRYPVTHVQAPQQYVIDDGKGKNWPSYDHLVSVPPIFFPYVG